MTTFTRLVLAGTFGLALTAAPIRTLANLDTVTLWELSEGFNFLRTFAPNGTPITQKLANLGSGSSDFNGLTPGEYYDIFYSSQDGTFDIDGEYITVLNSRTQAGEGNNIAEIYLNFTNSTSIAGTLASWVFAPAGSNPSSLANIGDGDNESWTQMGWGLNGETSRLTFSFGQSGGGGGANPVPEPATMGVIGIGLGAVALLRRRKEAV